MLKENVDEKSSSSIQIQLARNLMEAYLTVESPTDGAITRQQIEKALQEKDIVYGILEEELVKAVQAPSTMHTLIAKGSIAIQGDDARIEFKCLPLGNAPKVLDDGRVDFYNLNLIRNVEKGEVLAVRTPPAEGIPGRTVTGEEIPAKPGKNVPLIAGKNVELKEDGQIAVAASRGHAMVIDNKIEISEVHEVKGDIDFSTGNINFNGSVLINGNIIEGFMVTASGDVEVQGTVLGGTVVCDGNLKVRNGIIGNSKSFINVKGSVYAKFIENARIDAEVDVIVGHAVLNSQINAQRSIVINGKGALMGGILRAGECIQCKTVGSPMATCELEVGVSPDIRQTLAKLVKERKEKESHYDKALSAVNGLNGMKASGAVLNSDQLNLLAKLTGTEVKLAKQIETIATDIEKLEETLNLSAGRIMVQDTIFPGTKITMGIKSMTIKNQIRFVCIKLNKNEIDISAYK